MIDFYFSPTPNGWKVAMMLEECGLEYKTVLMNLPNGDQFDQSFLDINPNAKIPAIVDHEPSVEHDHDREVSDGRIKKNGPVTVFESGVILLYLAQKTRQFDGGHNQSSKELNEWLFWQAANLGPMAGQLSHFINYAPEKMTYPLNRYFGEYERCLGVLDVRLSQQQYILSEYSIVDMMTFPWAFIAKNLGVDLNNFPAVARWRNDIKNRPAVRNAINLHKNAQFTNTADANNSPQLFNQTAEHLNN